MSNDDKSKIFATYDDITEEDNHLPNWWLFILFASIVFSFGYWFVYHTTHSMPSTREEYTADVAALEKKLAMRSPMSNESLLALAKDPNAIAEGKVVFASTCAACHLQGQGLVGPNLTDKFWIHGNEPKDLASTVINGWPEKGMPPWGKVLGDDKVRKVVAFVLSIKNTNMPGKEPQGDPKD